MNTGRAPIPLEGKNTSVNTTKQTKTSQHTWMKLLNLFLYFPVMLMLMSDRRWVLYMLHIAIIGWKKECSYYHFEHNFNIHNIALSMISKFIISLRAWYHGKRIIVAHLRAGGDVIHGGDVVRKMRPRIASCVHLDHRGPQAPDVGAAAVTRLLHHLWRHPRHGPSHGMQTFVEALKKETLPEKHRSEMCVRT